VQYVHHCARSIGREPSAIENGRAGTVFADVRAREAIMKRVLRWNFSHDGEAPVICELCLTGEDRDYELRVPRQWSPIGRSVERFDDAFAAFQRHAMIERLLLDAGWVLDTFESERVTIH
jgi:hypothetical protein